MRNNLDDNFLSQEHLINNYANDENQIEGIMIDRIDEKLKQDPNLPEYQKINIDTFFHRNKQENLGQNGEKPLEDNKSDYRMKKVQIDLDSILKDKLVMWQNVDSWEFKFPETVFTGEEAPVAFRQQKQEIGTYPLSKLSEQQLQSIKDKGEFTIKIDSEYDLGTKWKMNPWFVKGRDNIRNTFLNTLSCCWNQILQFSCRLTWKQNQNQDIWTQIFTPNLLSGVRSFISLLEKIANLTVGTPKVRIYTDEEILQEIYQEEIKKTILKFSEFMDNSFFLFVKELDNDFLNPSFSAEQINQQSNLRNEINRINSDFRVKSQKLEKEKLSQLESGEKDQDLALLEILQEKQKLLFTMIEEQNFLENVQARKHLIQLIKATQITVRHYEKLQSTINLLQTELKAELLKNHPVKSLVGQWLHDKIKDNMKPIIEQLTVTCNQAIIKELKFEDLKQQQILFEVFNNFCENQETLLNQNRRRIEQKIKVPSRVFQTIQYSIGDRVLTRYVNNYGQVYYSQQQMQTKDISTSLYGWRIFLQFLRWKVWTVNVFGELISNLIDGQYGLKALFYSNPFPRDYIEQTGQKVPNRLITPYLEELRNLCRSITQSRANFEALPDRGIFGKNFARVCNYIECYFYRAIIIGIVVTVGMPIVILANCILSFILAITCWLWIPILLVIRSMFQLLIFDFDSPARKGQRQYNSFERIYWTYEAFPLIVAIVQSLVGALEIMLSLFSCVIIHPLLAFLCAFIAVGRIIISTSTDMFMYAITRQIGRQPELDSDIAWKLRGNGQGFSNVDSMEIEDVKCLVRSWLEKQELDQCVADIRKKLNEPLALYSRVVGDFFRQYGISSVYSPILFQNMWNLDNMLTLQYQNRIIKLPVLPQCNVKFTDQEIAQLVPACQAIVQSFIIGHYIGPWIFENRDIDNKDYKSLTERALIELFNNEEVLFGAGERFTRNQMKKVSHASYHQIQETIQKEANIQPLFSKMAPRYRKFKKTELCRFVGEEEIESLTRNANQLGVLRLIKNADPSSSCFFLPIQFFKKIE